MDESALREGSARVRRPLGGLEPGGPVATDPYRCYACGMARMVKVSVSVEKEKLRLAQEQAKREGVSLSAIVTRGLQHELDARARLEAALELYGPDGWPTPEERRKVIASWTTQKTKPRVKRTAA